MISKEELRSIPEMHRQIQHDKEHLLYLHEKATSLGSLAVEEERVQSSPDPDRMKYIEAAVDLEKEIEERERELLAMQEDAERWICTVGHKITRKILRYRYLNCYKWNQIAELLGYTSHWIAQLERFAVDELPPKKY